MAKEKKSNQQRQRGNKNNKNIQKESNNNLKSKELPHYSNNHRSGSHNRSQQKKGPAQSDNNINIKLKQTISSVNNHISGSNTSQPRPVSSKFVKPDQMQAVMKALGDLEAVLNSYQELEMDKCENVKLLVEYILKKDSPKIS